MTKNFWAPITTKLLCLASKMLSFQSCSLIQDKFRQAKEGKTEAMTALLGPRVTIFAISFGFGVIDKGRGRNCFK